MNQTVLITGAASGIGRAFADIFAGQGYDMVIVGRNLEKMNAMKDEYERKYAVKVTTVQEDLSKDNAAQKVFNTVKAQGIDVDVLINNAGVGDYGRFIDIPWQKERDLAGLDMISVMHMMHLYAAKSFVFSLSQAVYKEMEGTGVTVTCLCPGPTATNFEKEAEMKSNNKMFTWFKPMTAQEVAKEGFDALMKGKAVHVTKPRYRAFKFVTRFGSEKLKRDLTNAVNTGRFKNT